MIKSILISVLLSCMTVISVFGQDVDGTDRVVLGAELQPKDTSATRRFKNHLIAPKGEWQCGLSVMYADFSSANSDYMLLLQGVNAEASMLRLAPEAAYTFANNHAIGARFQYTNINGLIDTATADLLGNFNYTLENARAFSRSMSGCIFQRTYVGLDKYGRIGLFWDYILGYTRSKSQFVMGESDSAFTIKHKIHAGFAPGIVYFPMNNVSIQASITIADLSYNYTSAYEADVLTGSNTKWNAQASLNVLNINFGLTIHL